VDQRRAVRIAAREVEQSLVSRFQSAEMGIRRATAIGNFETRTGDRSRTSDRPGPWFALHRHFHKEARRHGSYPVTGGILIPSSPSPSSVRQSASASPCPFLSRPLPPYPSRRKNQWRFRWIEHTSQPFGSRPYFTVRPQLARCWRRNLTSLVPRHQLYALLDLWLRSHQEEQDTMDYGGGGHSSVDAFHHPRVPGLYRAYMLLSSVTAPSFSST